MPPNLMLMGATSALITTLPVTVEGLATLTAIAAGESFEGPQGPGGPEGEQGIQGEQGADGPSWTAVVQQAGDVTHALASFVDTDLVFTFVADSTYVIDLYLLCTSVAAATGYRFGFDVSAAVTVVALAFTHTLANTGTLSGGQSIADDAATGISAGVPAADTLTLVAGHGILVTGANGGTCRLRFGPEGAASATFKAGSVLRAWKAA